MAVPKRRKSASKRDKRRAQHDKVVAPNPGVCPKCGEPVKPHCACAACGEYRGRKVRQGNQDATA